MLGIAGAPGVGKTTLAEALVRAVPGSVHVPMDGFHLAHRTLGELGLVEVKGAPETFDAAGYVALLRRLREPGHEVVWAPEFRREIAARWDLRALDHEVRQSQRRRIAVAEALGHGARATWDFAPAYDASRRYIRSHRDLADLENLARYPPVERRKPFA